jgi:secondary thiamine-phosphate synthase enzyme
MTIVSKEIQLNTKGNSQLIDITDKVQREIGSSSIRNGLVTVFVPGSTGSLTTIEYERGVINDLKDAIERVAPRDLPYQHDAAWGDENGHAHVRSSIIGPSLVVPLIDGKMTLGTWQQIVFIDFDNRPRDRHIVVQILGE